MINDRGGHLGCFSSSSEKDTRRRMDEVFKLLCCVFCTFVSRFDIEMQDGSFNFIACDAF